MEIKHDIRSKMKQQIRQEEEVKVKEQLINIYNTMIDWGKPTLNLDLGNGYTVVCAIVENGEKKDDKKQTD